VTPGKALLHPHRREFKKELRPIFEHVENKDKRYELNLYIVGYEEQPSVEAMADEGRGPQE
jgi:hypothetical protein